MIREEDHLGAIRSSIILFVTLCLYSNIRSILPLINQPPKIRPSGPAAARIEPNREDCPARAVGRKMVMMEPKGERAGDLPVGKEPAGFDFDIFRDPSHRERADFGSEHDAIANRDRRDFTDDRHAFPRRRDRQKGVGALVKRVNDLGSSGDHRFLGEEQRRNAPIAVGFDAFNRL